MTKRGKEVLQKFDPENPEEEVLLSHSEASVAGRLRKHGLLSGKKRAGSPTRWRLTEVGREALSGLLEEAEKGAAQVAVLPQVHDPEPAENFDLDGLRDVALIVAKGSSEPEQAVTPAPAPDREQGAVHGQGGLAGGGLADDPNAVLVGLSDYQAAYLDFVRGDRPRGEVLAECFDRAWPKLARRLLERELQQAYADLAEAQQRLRQIEEDQQALQGA